MKTPQRDFFWMICQWYHSLYIVLSKVSLHCMSGLHWLFRDVCMFACAFAVGVGSSGVCMFHVLILMSILVLYSDWSALSQSSWIRRYIRVTYYYYYYYYCCCSCYYYYYYYYYYHQCTHAVGLKSSRGTEGKFRRLDLRTLPPTDFPLRQI